MAGINQKIRTVDYNAIQTIVSNVLGTGSVQSGYGQPVLSSQVSISSSVTVNEYAALRYDIINAYKHLFGTLPSGVDDQTEGAKVRYSLVDAPVDYWLTVANTINTQRRNLAIAGYRATITSTPAQQTWPGPLGTAWTGSLFCIVTAEWTNSELARFFFNGGGSIQLSSSRTGGSTTDQNTSWTSLLSTAGIRIFGGNTPGADTEPNDGSNYFRLSNVRQTWSSVTASSPYALNDWTILARTLDTPDVADNSAGTSRKIEFYVTWNDDHFPLGGPSATGSPTQPSLGFGPDAVDGTLTLGVSTVYPSQVLEPSGSGNWTVELPTITISDIQIVP